MCNRPSHRLLQRELLRVYAVLADPQVVLFSCLAAGRVFLWLFALIIALGVLHAFVLLPVLLVVVAPPTCGTHSEEIEMSDAEVRDFGGQSEREPKAETM